MLDNNIIAINEIAKLKAAGSSGGGSGTQFSKSISTIAQAKYNLTNLAFTSYPVTSGSQSYMRAFNHGSGQFSIASIPFYNSGATQTQFYVQPFQVNQSTGAITSGSGNTIWTNGSGNCNSTNTWGQAGPYVFNTGNHCAPGNGGNIPITTVYTASGNSVSGTYSNHNTYQPVLNENSLCTLNGGTAYWFPTVYSGNTGQAYHYVWSYDGGSLSNQQSSQIGSNTSTNYVIDVARQHGSAGVTGGGIRFFQDSNGAGQIHILSNTGGINTTISQSSVQVGGEANQRANGFELSNGTQIYYLQGGTVLLRNGNSLTNITTSADYAPISSRQSMAATYTTPVSQNSWISFVDNGNSIYELVKFRINPTTYKITIVGSTLLGNLTNNTGVANYGAYYLGAFITGSTNQYIVTVGTSAYHANPSAFVIVGSNPLSGS